MESLKQILSPEDIHTAVTDTVTMLRSKHIPEDQVDNTAFIGIMHGALYFFADLTREWWVQTKTAPITLLIHANSYNGQQQTDSVTTSMSRAEQKHLMTVQRVVLVDTVLDSGKTLNTVQSELEEQFPHLREFIWICLLMKEAKFIGPSDYLRVRPYIKAAWSIKEGLHDPWLMGYGMDTDGKGRLLPMVLERADGE